MERNKTGENERKKKWEMNFLEETILNSRRLINLGLFHGILKMFFILLFYNWELSPRNSSLTTWSVKSCLKMLYSR